MPAAIPLDVPSSLSQTAVAKAAKASAVDVLAAPNGQIGAAPVDFEQVLAAQLSGPGKVPDNVLDLNATGTPEATPNKAKQGADDPQDGGVAPGDPALVAAVPAFTLGSIPDRSQPATVTDDAAPARPGGLTEVHAASIPKPHLAAADAPASPGQAAGADASAPPIIALANPEAANVAASAAAASSGGSDARAETRLTGVRSQDASDLASPAPLVAAESGARVEVPPPAPKAVTAEIAAPVGSRGFGDEVGQRLVWMASQGHQTAELRLNPPALGPVEVRLTLSSDQASLTILSPHAAVRDAVQSNLPRLQDMLQSVGVNLGSVFVGADGSRQPSGERPHSSAGGAGPTAISNASGAVTAIGVSTAGPIRMGFGVVDTYA